MSSNSRVHVWPACWQLELTLLLIALVVTSISSLPIEASIFFWIFVILFSIKSSGDKSYDDHKVTELPCSPTDKDNTKLETKIYEELNSLLHSQQEDAFTRAEPLFGEYPRTYMECTGNRIWIESEDSYYAIWSSIHGTFSRNIFSSFTQFVQHLRELMQPVSYLKSIDFIDVCLTKQLCRTFIYSQVNIKTLQFSNCEIRVKPDVFQSFLKCLHVEKLISEESTYHCPNLLSDESIANSLVTLVQAFDSYQGDYVEPDGIEEIVYSAHEANHKILTKASSKLRDTLKKLKMLEDQIKEAIADDKAKDRDAALTVLIAMEEELKIDEAVTKANSLLEVINIKIDTIDTLMEKMHMQADEQRAMSRISENAKNEHIENNEQLMGDFRNTPLPSAPEFDDDDDRKYRTAIEHRPSSCSYINEFPRNPQNTRQRDNSVESIPNAQLERSHRNQNNRDLSGLNNRPLGTSTPYAQKRQVRYNLDDLSEQYTVNNIHKESYNAIRAPPIKLIKFGGNAEEFEEFWAMFDNLVNKSYMSNIEKMILLKDCLIDKAALAIKGIKIIPENYERMISKLKQKYENVKENRAIIVKKLFDLPAAENKAEKCAQTLDEIQALINQVTSSGYEIEDSTDPLWIETITKKFPYRILEGVLTENHDKKHVTVGKFVSQLDRAIRTKVSIERCIGNNYPKKDNNSKESLGKFQKPNHGNAEKSYNGSNNFKNGNYSNTGRPNDGNTSEARIKPCVYCGEDHKPKNCKKLASIEERWNFIKKQQLCANCLKSNHTAKDCGFDGCHECGNQKHHNSICRKRSNGSNNFGGKPSQEMTYQKYRSNNVETLVDSRIEEPREIPNQQSWVQSQNTAHLPVCQSVLMTAEGQVYNYKTKKFETALFFFDNGAHQSVIEESLADRLGIMNGQMYIIEMYGFGGNIQEFETQNVMLTVRTAFGQILEVPARTKKNLMAPINSAYVSKEDMEYMSQENIMLANKRVDGEQLVPQILIGIELESTFKLNVPDKVLPSGLWARRTVFGECLGGRASLCACATNLPVENSKLSMNTVTTSNELTEREMLKHLFELDQIGISTDEYSQNERVHSFYEEYKKSMKFENGIVIAPLPLKENSLQLADNLGVAWKRLASLCRVLDTNQEIKHCYDKRIQEYLTEGIIEKVEDKIPNTVGTYTMPHRGVWTPEKNKPLRVVFDASSKTGSEFSLNDVLFTGEAFTNKIHDLLITARLSKYILFCDVEAAFLQVRLKAEHRDLCRFLYRKDSSKPPTNGNVITYRFTRLPFGLSASPAILNMAIMAFLDAKNTSLALEIMNNMYVDNILLLADSEEELFQKYIESKELFQEIGMNLREYTSNSDKVNSMIPEQDRGKTGLIKVLGVKYDTNLDKFFIETGKPPDNNTVTKRSLLSELQSIYDPIGAVAPAIAHQKSLMRKAMKIEGGWKTVLPLDLQNKWKTAQTTAANGIIEIPRYVEYETGNFDSIWIFADASQLCLAACAYFVNSETKEVSSIITGKSKLSPQKQAFKIPRLELLAILLAHRLAQSITPFVKKEGIQIRIFNDSTVALCWIKNQRKLPIFVQNQVDRIKKLQSDIVSKGHLVRLFHVETAANVADIGTRGLEGAQLHNSDWVKGPSWIKQDESKWPIIPYEKVIENETYLSSEQIVQIPSQLSCTIKEIPNTNIIDVTKHSNYQNLLQVTTRLCKSAKLWLHKSKIPCRGSILSKFEISQQNTVDEIEMAEKIIILQDQAHICEKELKQRFRCKTFFKDETGILRCDSRLQNSYLPRDTKQPVLLVPKSHVTKLIVTHFHEQCGHGGKEHTLCSIRQRFWLPKPSSTIRTILQKCVPCKKTQGLPFKAPDMPSLPNDRVMICKPFQNTGLDFMGPILMKNEENAYVCLYTCLTTRLVHLEVVENMSASAFLSCFVRFSSRRGVPSVIRSDNGTNHVLGEKIIQHLFDKTNDHPKSAMNYFAINRIKWIFNPPSSPWMGGVWERLVGSVKRAAKKSIGRKKLEFIELCTLFARIEAMINTRPLTSIDPKDVDSIPLRPVDFLNGIQKFSIPDGSDVDPEDQDYEPEFLQTFQQTKESYEFAVSMANKFWQCWQKLYLTELRDAHKTRFKQHRPGARSIPEVGEIVLIEKDNCPRGMWKYAKVIELIQSSDGKCRTVKVQKANKKISVKPIIRLYPMEVRSTHKKLNDQIELEVNSEDIADDIVENIQSKEDDERPLVYFKQNTANCATNPVKSNLVQLCMFMAILSIADANPIIDNYFNCSSGEIQVSSIMQPFKLCFQEKCRIFRKLEHESSFIVPRHSWNKPNNVSLTIGNYIEHKLCEPHHVCQKSSAFLSKHLIGNPHCWPEGAIISIGTILLILLLLISAVAIFVCRKCTNCRKNKPNATENMELTVFPTIYVPRALPLITAVLLLCSLTEACQEGYMRQSIDIKCNDQGSCYNDYRREILFDSIHSQMCIGITQNGLNIGKIKITKLMTAHKCIKTVHYYTKDTTPVEYTAFRCPSMGSCDYLTNVCKVYNPFTRVPELSEADPYPGYFVCQRRNCITQFCPCGLLGMACEYLRVAHVPNNEKIYEVFGCSHWAPEITIEIETQIYDKKTRKILVIDPYVKYGIHNINVTIVSFQQKLSPVWNKQYLVSGEEALIMPESYNLPVLCSSRHVAEKEFSRCQNTMVCSCFLYLDFGKCACPPNSIKDIQSRLGHSLPLFTKNLQVMLQKDIIVATDSISELTLIVESDYIADSTELSYDANCDVTAGELVGCYSCIESAKLNLTCVSDMEFMIILYCENQQITIECKPEGYTSEKILTFEESAINETCTYVSNHQTKQVLVSGKLDFHSDISPLPVFIPNSTYHKSSAFDWFDGFTFPDLGPVFNLFTNHWKLTLAICITIIVIVAISIQFGPTAVITVFDIITKVFSLIVQLIWYITKSIYQITCSCFKCCISDPAKGQNTTQ